MRSPILSKLTPIISYVELTHFDSEASKYTLYFLRKYKIKGDF